MFETQIIWFYAINQSKITKPNKNKILCCNKVLTKHLYYIIFKLNIIKAHKFINHLQFNDLWCVWFIICFILLVPKPFCPIYLIISRGCERSFDIILVYNERDYPYSHVIEMITVYICQGSSQTIMNTYLISSHFVMIEITST